MPFAHSRFRERIHQFRQFEYPRESFFRRQRALYLHKLFPRFRGRVGGPHGLSMTYT